MLWNEEHLKIKPMLQWRKVSNSTILNRIIAYYWKLNKNIRIFRIIIFLTLWINSYTIRVNGNLYIDIGGAVFYLKISSLEVYRIFYSLWLPQPISCFEDMARVASSGLANSWRLWGRAWGGLDWGWEGPQWAI